jgi:hypothetical protein
MGRPFLKTIVPTDKLRPTDVLSVGLNSSVGENF